MKFEQSTTFRISVQPDFFKGYRKHQEKGAFSDTNADQLHTTSQTTSGAFSQIENKREKEEKPLRSWWKIRSSACVVSIYSQVHRIRYQHRVQSSVPPWLVRQRKILVKVLISCIFPISENILSSLSLCISSSSRLFTWIRAPFSLYAVNVIRDSDQGWWSMLAKWALRRILACCQRMWKRALASSIFPESWVPALQW